MTVAEVVESHVGICKILAERYANTVHDFDDLFQEAQLAVWLEAQKRPGDDLRRLAGTVVHRRLRRVSQDSSRSMYKPKAVYSTADDEVSYAVEQALGAAESAEHEALQRLAQQHVRSAVASLSPTQRKAAEGFLKGRSARETAATEGVHPCTVETWRKAAFNTLRLLLEEPA